MIAIVVPSGSSVSRLFSASSPPAPGRFSTAIVAPVASSRYGAMSRA
jgi:hypothetical protein